MAFIQRRNSGTVVRTIVYCLFEGVRWESWCDAIRMGCAFFAIHLKADVVAKVLTSLVGHSAERAQSVDETT